MANQELLRFPRGQIAVGGDLHQVREGELSLNNNASLVYTLRKKGKPAGVVKGNEDVTGSFVAMIDEDDREKDWFAYAHSLKGLNFQYKSPKVTDVVEGVIQQVTLRFPDGGAIEATINLIGIHID